MLTLHFTVGSIIAMQLRGMHLEHRIVQYDEAEPGVGVAAAVFYKTGGLLLSQACHFHESCISAQVAGES